MKKFAAIAATLALLSTPVFAAGQGGFAGPQSMQQSGFSGPNASVTTAANAKNMADDAWVTLRGNIVQQIGKDTYLFKDASGTVNVEISKKRWHGLIVAPQDVVEIQGEVDREWNSLEIDVKRIIKVGP